MTADFVVSSSEEVGPVDKVAIALVGLIVVPTEVLVASGREGQFVEVREEGQVAAVHFGIDGRKRLVSGEQRRCAALFCSQARRRDLCLHLLDPSYPIPERIVQA